MDIDDNPIGQILSRRDTLKLLGVGSAAFFAWNTAPAVTNTLIPTSMTGAALACVVRPELTIGPYFVDDQLNRSDIRPEPADGSVKKGIPLTLAIGVFDIASHRCAPLEGAQVDIWHCDTQGHYSGVDAPGFDSTGLKFLRGYQLTDTKGKAQFRTIYPGWYPGRAVHIHFMIRTIGAEGQRYEFVSQFFFDDVLTDRVHALKPYARKGPRNTRNVDDNIYSNGGDQLLLDVTGNGTSGYIARINIGLDIADKKVGVPDSFDRPGGSLPQ